MLNFPLPVVGVAQLVEHRTVAPNVVGSNPIAHPTRSSGSFPQYAGISKSLK